MKFTYLNDAVELQDGKDALSFMVRMAGDVTAMFSDMEGMAADIQRGADWQQNASRWMQQRFGGSMAVDGGGTAAAAAAAIALMPSRNPLALPPTAPTAPPSKNRHRDPALPPTVTLVHPNASVNVLPGSTDRTWQLEVETSGLVLAGEVLCRVAFQTYQSPPLVQVSSSSNPLSFDVRVVSPPTTGAVELTANAIPSNVTVIVYGVNFPTTENFD